MPWKGILFATVLALNLVLLVGLVFGDNGLLSYLELKKRHDGLTAEIREADQLSRELSQEIRLMTSDPEYQEMVVRDELNYLRAGEVLYLFPAGPTGTGAQNAR